jgi:hypothetical protein
LVVAIRQQAAIQGKSGTYKACIAGMVVNSDWTSLTRLILKSQLTLKTFFRDTYMGTTSLIPGCEMYCVKVLKVSKCR